MITFMKFRKIYFLLSGSLLIISLVSLALWRLRPSIDFTGGTLLEFQVVNSETTAGREEVTKMATEAGLEGLTVSVTGERSFLLRAKPIDEAKKEQLLSALNEKLGEVEVSRLETVGPTLGEELLAKTLIAVILATLVILAYIAWQFKNRMYGLCAILAMFHDSIILVGSFSLLGHFLGIEVDTLFVTAVLTTLSFSTHDTVVVFNSIREQVGNRSLSGADFEAVVNRALNATIVRSLNNSFTIIFMLLCLVLLGGETIRWFAVALLIGTIVGTYSSTFVAAPLLVVWQNLRARRT